MNIPCPLKIAEQMQLPEIQEVLSAQTSESEDDDISAYNDSFKRGDVINSGTAEKVTRVDHASPGFVTGLGSNQGTCITIREVMGRTSAYEWAGVISGGFHAKGVLDFTAFVTR